MRWYLVHTKPARESLAEENLQRQGYAVYLPRVVGAAGDRVGASSAAVPLFPRYLFLRLAEGSQALSPVCYSIGVSAVVRFGSSYAIVPDGIIDELRGR